jgi:hypothetical protein
MEETFFSASQNGELLQGGVILRKNRLFFERGWSLQIKFFSL